MTARVALYSAVDDELTHYEVDVESASLAKRATVKAPANVQYAWPHPSRQYLYVATSNRGAGLNADYNHVSAWRIDPHSGALSQHGVPQPLLHRAVHICVSPDGKFVLSGHNLPQSGVTVHPINSDGTLGQAVHQPQPIDCGPYPHQVRMTPSGRTTIVVDRGNAPKDGKPGDPGALRLFRFNNGVHEPLAVIAPNGGRSFGVRHLDFHPTQPWVYVSLEIQSVLNMFRMNGEMLEPQAAYAHDLLADRAHIKPRQMAGTVHLHPSGKFVYFANRADWTTDYNGKQVFNGGENSIAVFAIDPQTGEPTLIQHADTHNYHVRTFSFDPSGKLMVAASIHGMHVRKDDTVLHVPAAMSVFRVGDDGRLHFVRRYDVERGERTQYWTGMVELP
jgi:6-phosphogluconolactonase